MTSVPVVNVRRSAPETTVSRIVALVTMFLLVGSFYYVPLVVLWALYQVPRRTHARTHATPEPT